MCNSCHSSRASRPSYVRDAWLRVCIGCDLSLSSAASKDTTTTIIKLEHGVSSFDLWCQDCEAVGSQRSSYSNTTSVWRPADSAKTPISLARTVENRRTVPAKRIGNVTILITAIYRHASIAECHAE